MEVVLEYVRKNRGRYVLFGDNLASHFNVDVVRVAEENDIHSVMLPPNSTHILQPLDVAVFSSLKQSWRVILDERKREVRTEGAFNKQFFPSLLKQLINSQESCMQKNLQSGFRACGIHPLQHSEPLSKLPSTTSLNVSESNSSLNETLIGLLKNNRGCGEKKRQRRGKKIAQPGEVYPPQNLIVTQRRKPLAQKDQNAPVLKKYGHVPAVVRTGKGKTMMAIAGSYVICAISSITYSVPE